MNIEMYNGPDEATLEAKLETANLRYEDAFGNRLDKPCVSRIQPLDASGGFYITVFCESPPPDLEEYRISRTPWIAVG